MRKPSRLGAEYVEFIPEQLDAATLYVSRRYATASHLCCCGCGLKVVTPLNPAKWRLTDEDGLVSLHPSVGNWSFPCQSHYWIRRGRVVWAGAMSPEKIAAVRAADRRAAEAIVARPLGLWGRIRRGAQDVWMRSKQWFGL
ncbi:MAG: hypothetical protein DI565_15940 [Ancylobacter novellus]|uniref:Uncharacterized protein n=1 Tax=Ancylobacter novellus TaxID=921 RepID=A0A2W5K4S2_ANCNO|nr:MAG: hypothetical protein DI565_15940 [Ancylobacter novellus]